MNKDLYNFCLKKKKERLLLVLILFLHEQIFHVLVSDSQEHQSLFNSYYPVLD